MKRVLLAGPAMALTMAVSTPAMAIDGYECHVPNGATNALAKGDLDKALNIIISANTNQGNGNGGEVLCGKIFRTKKLGLVLTECGIVENLPVTDTDLSLGDGKDPAVLDLGRFIFFCASDPGNSADKK